VRLSIGMPDGQNCVLELRNESGKVNFILVRTWATLRLLYVMLKHSFSHFLKKKV
jgi:hypothetical protein